MLAATDFLEITWNIVNDCLNAMWQLGYTRCEVSSPTTFYSMDDKGQFCAEYGKFIYFMFTI